MMLVAKSMLLLPRKPRPEDKPGPESQAAGSETDRLHEGDAEAGSASKKVRAEEANGSRTGRGQARRIGAYSRKSPQLKGELFGEREATV